MVLHSKLRCACNEFAVLRKLPITLHTEMKVSDGSGVEAVNV
jgi:hypothetical protein